MKLDKKSIELLTAVALGLTVLVFALCIIVTDGNSFWPRAIVCALFIAIGFVSYKLKAKCDTEADAETEKQKVTVPPGTLGISLDAVTGILMVVAWVLVITKNLLTTSAAILPTVSLTFFCLITIVMSYLPLTIGGSGSIQNIKQARYFVFGLHAFALICALACLGLVIMYYHMSI